MLLRLLRGYFFKQKKITALVFLSVVMGTSVVSAIVTLSVGISEKVASELRSFGANIRVEPKIEGLASLSIKHEGFLREGDIKRINTIFWRHNITGIVPYLHKGVKIKAKNMEHVATISGVWFQHEMPLPDGGTFITGVRTVNPWWTVEGEWVGDGETDRIMLGASLSGKLGAALNDEITVRPDNGAFQNFRVSGIISTGGIEDEQAFADLSIVQRLTGLEDRVSMLLVSAVVTPMEPFAYKNPAEMSPIEYEKWYCTAYVTSVAKQIEEVVAGSKARPIWRIAEAEGNILRKLGTAVILLCLSVLASSCIGVSTTLIASLQIRVGEIGLMKALGADRYQIGLLFLSEALAIGLLGGIVAYFTAWCIRDMIGSRVFGTTAYETSLLLPITIGISIAICVFGYIIPLGRALRIKVKEALLEG